MFGRSLPAKILFSLLWFVVGAFIGLVAGIYHRTFAPWGVVGGLLLIAVFGLALRLIHPGRTVTFLGLLGVQLGVLALALGLYRGFFIVDDILGWVFSMGMIAVALIALAWPDLRGTPRYDGKAPLPSKGDQ